MKLLATCVASEKSMASLDDMLSCYTPDYIAPQLANIRLCSCSTFLLIFCRRVCLRFIFVNVDNGSKLACDPVSILNLTLFPSTDKVLNTLSSSCIEFTAPMNNGSSVDLASLACSQTHIYHIDILYIQ